MSEITATAEFNNAGLVRITKTHLSDDGEPMRSVAFVAEDVFNLAGNSDCERLATILEWRGYVRRGDNAIAVSRDFEAG